MATRPEAADPGRPPKPGRPSPRPHPPGQSSPGEATPGQSLPPRDPSRQAQSASGRSWSSRSAPGQARSDEPRDARAARDQSRQAQSAPGQSAPRRGPHMPEAVRGKKPVEVVVPIVAPPPGVVTGPLPAPPSQPGRHPFRGTPQPLPKVPPRPIRGKRPVPIGLIALALLFLGLFVIAMGLGAATALDPSRLFGRDAGEPPPRSFPVLDPSRPEQLSIPAIDVRAPILDVGLATDGSVDVPPLDRHDEAGWFSGGPTPGQFGPALIVGHADTRTGASVFHDLPRLKPGQRIEVRRADGSVAIFEVNSVEQFNKGRLPIQRVYGDFSRPSLRLLTCGGTWLGGHRGYADNVVVFASLVAAKDA